jgi:hypothetical protein
MAEGAAIAACAVLAALAVFQAALAAGAPLGRFAWGGGEAVLTPTFRIGSLISIGLYALFGAILLAGAGVIAGPGWVRPLVWALAAYFAVGIGMNGISRSPGERAVMTPVALFLFLAAAAVALS